MFKQRNLFPYALIFSSFLFFGLWTGNRLSPILTRARNPLSIHSKNTSISPSSAKPNYPIPQQLPESEGNFPLYEQTNFLFLVVNNLQSKDPDLLSLWLLISVDGNARWIVFPIANRASPSNSSEVLINAFALTRDHRLSDHFLKAIEERQILWHHYILLDETTLANLHSSLGYPVNQDTLFDPLHTLCQGLNQQPFALSSLKSLVNKHIFSDIDPAQIFDEWQLQIIQNGGLYCEFPSQ